LEVCLAGVYITPKGTTHFAASKRLYGQTFHTIRTASTSSNILNSAPASAMADQCLYKWIEFKGVIQSANFFSKNAF
jgi:hypothetical protein